MKKLVVVSNRLPAVRSAGGPDDRNLPVGGLTGAVHAVLKGWPGSLWFGWSGESAKPAAGRLRRSRVEGVDLLGLPLSTTEVKAYYHGFCNAALWPLFHSFQGRVRLDMAQEACYRLVQGRFAAAVRDAVRPGDLVWVHDYHLLLLGRELRRLGWEGRTGFFLHTPFPSYDLWQVLPDPRGFLEAMLDYDVVGFHVRGSLDNYAHACARVLGATWDGERLRAGGRVQRVGVYPVGIEPRDFLPSPPESGDRSRTPGELARVVRGRALILGVDRLDYTKGIPERVLAFELFLKAHPQWRKRVSFVQIASPSRTGVAEYVEQKRRVEALVGRINGEHAEHDWVPIRYLYRSYPRERLARFYREADVGLVTPLRDGMNLVAKEFVASQDPAAPGVLVLSRFAGAAEELPEAVIVNPYIPSDTAEGIARALSMPLAERRERHAALLERILEGTASDWANRFLADLEDEPDAPASTESGRRDDRRRRQTLPC